MRKEEYAIVLEYLPNGYPLEGKMMPVAQAVGEITLVLLELVPRRNVELEIGEKVYIGQGKRDKIYYILGKLKPEKLTEGAKKQLEETIQKTVEENEKIYVEFFNTAQAINKRVHQIEILPGFGKKHMQEIINGRETKKFETFEEMKKKIPHLPDPKKAIEKRIFKEITTEERNKLFVI